MDHGNAVNMLKTRRNCRICSVSKKSVF